MSAPRTHGAPAVPSVEADHPWLLLVYAFVAMLACAASAVLATGRCGEQTHPAPGVHGAAPEATTHPTEVCR